MVMTMLNLASRLSNLPERRGAAPWPHHEYVRYSRLKRGSLCLSSTAVRHSVAAVPLWLHRLTHQGVLTRRPCSPSLAERATFSRRYSAPQQGPRALQYDTPHK